MAKVSENMVSQDYFGRGDYIGGFGGIKLFWVVSANFGRQQLEELQFYSNFCCVFLISQKSALLSRMSVWCIKRYPPGMFLLFLNCIIGGLYCGGVLEGVPLLNVLLCDRQVVSRII